MRENAKILEGGLLRAFLQGKDNGALLEKDGLARGLNPKILKFQKKGLPSLTTHILKNSNDIILKSCQEQGLENKKQDRVKVIFYPAYLTGSDGLLDLNCYESIEGSHLGVFPSLYEPWGYTTLETAALGVAALTTDCSGLGRFLLENKKSKKYPGIFVLRRFHRKEEATAGELSKILYDFAGLSREERIQNKIASREAALLCDWKILIKNYIQAHNLALKKR